VARDVTERQRADARFRGLLETVPDAMVCIRADGRIALVNAQTERLFGYRRDELVGQPVEMLVRDAGRPNLLENAWKFTSGQNAASIEFGANPAGDGRLCCFVRDNGAGFDPAYSDQPFQRLHRTRDFPAPARSGQRTADRGTPRRVRRGRAHSRRHFVRAAGDALNWRKSSWKEHQ
jgi:PAS domain S-box-containing protein